MKSIVGYLKENVDTTLNISVYSRNREMKLVNQSKVPSKDDPIERVQQVILNDQIYKHFITCYINKDAIPLSQLKLEDVVATQIELKLLIQ